MIFRPFYRFETGCAFERRWNPLLGLDESAFIDELATTVAPKPAEMAAILLANRGKAP